MPTLERDMRDKEFTFPAGAEVNIIPVMQVEGLNKIDEASLPDILPVLALRNAVVFPGAVFPITIGREKSIKLIRDAERDNQRCIYYSTAGLPACYPGQGPKYQLYRRRNNSHLRSARQMAPAQLPA